MKKLSLVLATAGLTASLGAFAATPTDAQPYQVVVPNLKAGIDITLEGLLVQPANSDADYATSSASFAYNSSKQMFGIPDAGDVGRFAGDSRAHSVDPNYNFGFRVGLGYTFPESGNDVQLSWTHYSHGHTDGFDLADDSALKTRFLGLPLTTGQFSIPVPVSLGGPTLPVTLVLSNGDVSVSSSADTKLDAVDLDVGQYIDVGTRLRMRMFAGLRLARVSSDLSTTFAEDDANYFVEIPGPGKDADGLLSSFGNEQLNSKFTGMGPRLGVDAVYHLGHSFGFVAKASASVLVGESESNSSFLGGLSMTGIDIGMPNNNDDADPAEFVIDVSSESEKSARVVPVLDAKLGLNYTHTFQNQSLLTIEAGYQATQYINAVDRLTVSTAEEPFATIVQSIISSPSGADVVPFVSHRSTSSIGFSGPYLSLNWKA
jgi:hypothetical protein